MPGSAIWRSIYRSFAALAKTISKPTPADIQVKIDSGNWDARGTIGLPGSSSINFTAKFLCPSERTGMHFWPLRSNVTLDFPSIFLANAPQFFHPEIFRDGILEWKTFSLRYAATSPHHRRRAAAEWKIAECFPESDWKRVVASLLMELARRWISSMPRRKMSIFHFAETSIITTRTISRSG